MAGVKDGGERGGLWARGASDKNRSVAGAAISRALPAAQHPARPRARVSLILTAPREVRATGTILQMGKTRLGKITQAVSSRDGV